MEEKQLHDELASIRSLMERSSKFISLSGLSGILVGFYALIGAFIAYKMIYTRNGMFSTRDYVIADVPANPDTLVNLILIALAVLTLSLVTVILLTIRKAKKKGQQIWGRLSRTVLFNLAVPVVAGGLLILIFILRGYFSIVAPASLIFYGLALLSASNFTFGDVRYLGMLEIILGLIAALMPGYGLLFWAIGFGVLHIIYGSIMYFKYDG
ncbi:hypothetical protein DJ568_06535 [Mucilaginibacter hurinus]|uniref:Uncharacterized protein n=1 Tax=Mucilaginibacter hurinus TaxID=2201324 RepID=A0A367GS50_9SPHI|nr:hypothetical protein [Mucilaginibacter hurinus]RCH55543.1 hypothetical protein DJ568_06535 [Mucilaginibacter hurinus]